jgi:dCTP deaminase
MIKTGGFIKHYITPAPHNTQIQPASVDLTLGNTFITYAPGVQTVDSRVPCNDGIVWICDCFTLLSGQFILATTHESVKIPNTMVGRVEGRSSLGRLGLAVHITAGYLDPGFEGKITLEIYNHFPRPVAIFAGQRICQLTFLELDGFGEYRGAYQGQITTTQSAGAR